MTPDDDVKANYQRIKDERGCSWSDLARDMDSNDAGLAAWMRRQDARDTGTVDRGGKAPKGRRAPSALEV